MASQTIMPAGSTTRSGNTKTSEPEDQLKVINDKLDKLSKLNKLPEAVKELKASVEYMSSMFDSIKLELDVTKKKAKEQQAEINQLKTENLYLNKTINSIQERTKQQDIYSRRNNVELHGIEKIDNENLEEVASTLAETLKLPFDVNNIEAIHRLKRKKTDRPPPILVRFVNRKDSDAWKEKKKTKLESLTIAGGTSTSKIFINENLPKEVNELFWQARIRGKQLQYKYVWVKNGHIYMRQEDASEIIKITRIDDLPRNTANPGRNTANDTKDTTSNNSTTNNNIADRNISNPNNNVPVDSNAPLVTYSP